MRQKILWLDLAVCSVWTLVLIEETNWYKPVAVLIFLLLMVWRTTISLALYRGEKRSWLTLVSFLGLSAMMAVRLVYIARSRFSLLFFSLFGTEFDPIAAILILGLLVGWMWAMPILVYIVALCRGRLFKTELPYGDMLGGILWHDNRARTYSLMMLAAILSLYAGLDMEPRLCLYACIVVPTISFCLLAKYYHVEIDRLWVMIVAMFIFCYAQPQYGLVRIYMLCTSLAMVAWMCFRFYRSKGLLSVAALSTIYIGILLPSLSIGYNQYVGINAPRVGMSTLEPYKGLFLVWNATKEKFGVRDRYGILVEPEYEWPILRKGTYKSGDIELRKNGYIIYYDLSDNTLKNADDIRHELQDSVCDIISRHISCHDYGYQEYVDVAVTECLTGKTVSHVRAKVDRDVYYVYNANSYIPADTVALESGTFVRDTLTMYGDIMHILHYACDISDAQHPVYSIGITASKRTIPEPEELTALADEVIAVLKH